MKKINKFLLALSVFSFCFVGGVSALNASAQTEITSVNDVTLSMVKGASIRYALPVEETEEAKKEAYKQNGIKFAVCLSENDYIALEELEGTKYTSVSYGVLIAPESYGTLDADTVFGVNGGKRYDWAVWNEESGVWEYTASEYTRITNVVSETMYLNENAYDEFGNKYTRYEWSASLTNLKQENLTRKFQGVGYVAYSYVNGSEEVTEYVFAEDNNNVRSMVQVAQLAVEDPKNAEIATGIQEAYVMPVTDVERTYTVEHYLLSNDNDSETLLTNEGLTTSVTATIDDPINYTELVSNGEKNTNYIFADYSNKNQIGAKVYADRDNTVKLYYKNAEVKSTIVKSDSGFAGSNSSLVSNDTAFGMVFRLGYAKANTNTMNNWRLDYRFTGSAFIARFGLEYAFSSNTIKIYSSVNVVSGSKTKTFTDATQVQEIKNRIATNSYYFVIGRSASSESDANYSLYTVYADLDLDGVVENTEAVFTLDFSSNANNQLSMKFGPGCAAMGAAGEKVFCELTTFAGNNGINRALESVSDVVTEKYNVTSGRADTRTYFENYTVSDNNVLIADVKFAQATAEENATADWCLDLRAYNNASENSGFCALASIIYTYDSTAGTGTLSIGRRNYTSNRYQFKDTDDALRALANGELQLVVVRETNSFNFFVAVDGSLIFVDSYTVDVFGAGTDFLRLGFGTWGTIGAPKDSSGMQVTYTVYDGIN